MKRYFKFYTGVLGVLLSSLAFYFLFPIIEKPEANDLLTISKGTLYLFGVFFVIWLSYAIGVYIQHRKKRKNKQDDLRVINTFLFLPTIILDRKRWLCRVKIEQKWQTSYDGWVNNKWID